MCEVLLQQYSLLRILVLLPQMLQIYNHRRLSLFQKMNSLNWEMLQYHSMRLVYKTLVPTNQVWETANRVATFCFAASPADTPLVIKVCLKTSTSR